MGEVIRFIQKQKFLLFFLIFESFSFYLIVNYNQTQKETFFSSSNRFAATVLEISGNTRGYFFLKKANDELSRENAYLKTLLPEQSVINIDDLFDFSYETPENSNYTYIPAKVINNSINKSNNYITLNSGENHNVKAGMGVISPRGLVGIVSNVSSHYATVLSLLNTKFRVSAKLRDSDYFGSLSWDGKSYRQVVLSEIPAHAPVHIGEAVVTSGYSAIFPEGILIGIVENFIIEEGEGFYTIKVKLSVDFKNLNYVTTVEKITADEQHELENITYEY
ncbi:MAG: rod shape-determining protein MreC [Marinilabiliaceae bacterium]|nr:rod shape-determining protein MreC [Marinilabiliaceae bacterium]